MKKVTITVLLLSYILSSCESVEPGKKGVQVSWGGKTNMEQVYGEGLHYGINWLVDDMVQYDVRERTQTLRFEFNDKNNMLTGIEIALDYNLDPKNVQRLHTKINDYETKLVKTIKSAAKEVIPQYTASELNLTKRNEAEQKISEILSKELPEFYVQFARIQLTDVDIPKQIATAAEETARQLEINKLELEKVQAAENRFKAAEFDAKTKDILSQPKMLQLYKLELEEKWIKKWNGSFGNNNVFGTESMSIIKGNTK